MKKQKTSHITEQQENSIFSSSEYESIEGDESLSFMSEAEFDISGEQNISQSLEQLDRGLDKEMEKLGISRESKKKGRSVAFSSALSPPKVEEFSRIVFTS